MKTIFHSNNLKRKLPFILSTLFLISFSIYDSTGQITIWTEDFETNGNTANGGDSRYSSPNDFYDATTDDDYWGRVRVTDRNYFLTDVSTGLIANSIGTYGGASGSFFYAGEDLDDTGAGIGSPDGNDVKQILFPNINILGAKSMTFKGLFAAGNTNACGGNAYDAADYMEVYYSIDGGVEVLGLCFNPDLECNIPMDTSNEPLFMDPNCDGDGGEGTPLSNSFAEFSFPIAGTGTSLEIRVEIYMDAGNEEVAMDFFRVESATPLPVELHAFRAQKVKEVAKLNWYTSAEINNDFFAVERSNDGFNFEEIGIVEGQGNAFTTHSYDFVDNRPTAGVNYYRLKQVDWDGSFDYSKVIPLAFENSRTNLSIVPNPFKDMVTLSLEETSNKNTQIEVFNLLGQRVHADVFGRDQLSKNIDLSALDQGTYMLRIGDGVDSVVKRIVKF